MDKILGENMVNAQLYMNGMETDQQCEIQSKYKGRSHFICNNYDSLDRSDLVL